jgi:NAD(P)H-dependent FMN reductase
VTGVSSAGALTGSGPGRRLLVVHHTASPALAEMLDSTVRGTHDEMIEGVEVVLRPALTASVVDVLEADGYLLGTPANIGYISGALKHFFDNVFYPCQDATAGRPWGGYVHGNLDTSGAVHALESITAGLGWKPVAPVLTVTGAVTREAREACYELGGIAAATLMQP